MDFLGSEVRLEEVFHNNFLSVLATQDVEQGNEGGGDSDGYAFNSVYYDLEEVTECVINAKI